MFYHRVDDRASPRSMKTTFNAETAEGAEKPLGFSVGSVISVVFPWLPIDRRSHFLASVRT